MSRREAVSAVALDRQAGTLAEEFFVAQSTVGFEGSNQGLTAHHIIVSPPGVPVRANAEAAGFCPDPGRLTAQDCLRKVLDRLGFRRSTVFLASTQSRQSSLAVALQQGGSW